MISHRELCLEQKINLIKGKDQGASHRRLSQKVNISLVAVSNILKRKGDYTNNYEANRNKKLQRKL